MSRHSWLRAALELDGFVGWVPWSACPPALNGIDGGAGGVYVVYRAAADEPQFLDRQGLGEATRPSIEPPSMPTGCRAPT